eukprot:s2853_g3.t1
MWLQIEFLSLRVANCDECYFLRPLSESGAYLILAAMKRPAASIAKRPAVKAAAKTKAKSRAKPKAKAPETGRPMDEARDLLMKLSEGAPYFETSQVLD